MLPKTSHKPNAMDFFMFSFLCLPNYICYVFEQWVTFCCNIYYAFLVCIVLMMDHTHTETIVLCRYNSMW